MEFVINRLDFLQQVTTVSRAIVQHSPKLILRGILIDVKQDRIVLTGSNKDFVIQSEIMAGEPAMLSIQQTGSMVVEAKVFGELLRRMDGPVLKVVSLDDVVMRLSCLDGNFDLVGMPGRDYEALALDRPPLHLQMTGKLLKEIFDQVGYATSEKDSRQVLMGINLACKDSHLYATATDSIRMARKVVPLECEEEFSITIPKSTFSDTVRSLKEDDTVDLYIGKKKIQIVDGHTVYQTQLYEGVYPDASRIIPTQFISTLEVGVNELEGMLDRATIYTTSNTASGEISPVRMDCSEEAVGVQVLTSDIGSCRQPMDGARYSGQPLALSFNAKLVLDALRGLKSKGIVQLGFTGELRPIRITNPEDDTLTMVVVPIRSS